MIEIHSGIWRSKLPLARDVRMFAERGGRSLVDLTRRPRDTVRRACERYGVRYMKFPLPYDGGDIDGAVAHVLAQERPVLFHCFHGRDRTGAVALGVLAVINEKNDHVDQ